MAYTVVNLDRMSGTEDSSQLLSVKFFAEEDSTEVESDIENGAVVVVGALLPNEREVRKATVPTGAETINQLALIANPEVIYDETVHHPLEDYINKAGEVIRAYRFHQNDNFSVTKEGFTSTPAAGDVGKYVVLGEDTTKFVLSSTTTSVTVIGVLDEIFNLGNTTYYNITVAM